MRGLRTQHFRLVALIAFTLLARLLFDGWLGLGIDESYMAAASRSLHLGYFDHPPIAWWLAWAGQHLGAPGSDLAVRLPFVLLFALSTWLMFRLTADLFGKRAGFWAAAALNGVPVLGLAAGSWVLPDGPLIAALLGAAVCLIRALAGPRSAWGWWLGAGACFGLAALSKYTAAPVGIGAILYLLTHAAARRWFSRPQPYVAGLLTLVMFAPVVIWNAHHGWASVLFQGDRAGGRHWHPFGPIAVVAGSALFFLPWIYAPLALCVVRALRRGPAEPRGWLLACLSVPTVLLFALVSLRGHVLFHWAAPGTMLALPLLGDAIARSRPSRILQLGVVGTVLTMALGTLFVATEARFNWLPKVFEGFALGTDPDLAVVDWTSLRLELLRRGELHAGTLVGATRWADAGKIDYALRGEVPVICLGTDPREYGFSAPPAAHNGQDVIIVSPRETLLDIRQIFGFEFDAIAALPPVMLLHAGRPAMLLPLFLGRRLHAAK